MKLRAQKEGLAVKATVATVEAKDTLMTISGDNTVAKAGANAIVIGRLVVPARAVNGLGTVETKFKELVEIKTGGALAAGVPVKLAAVDGTTGENIVTAWVSGTDGLKSCTEWSGKGTAGGVAEVLAY
jgi:hypothetical protein